MTEKNVIDGGNVVGSRSALALADKKLVMTGFKDAIVCALKAAAIAECQVEYSGQGDSGSDVEVSCTLDNGEPGWEKAEGLLITGPLRRQEWVNGAWQWELVTVTKSLEDALEALCEMAVEFFGHSGFENGDGGGGTLKLTVATGALELIHYEMTAVTTVSRLEPEVMAEVCSESKA